MARRTFGVAMLALCVVLLGMLLAGCENKADKPVNLTNRDSGVSQKLYQGQLVHIRLPANPSTGYMWAVEGTLPYSLEQTSDSTYETTSTAIGAGGVETWTFRVKAQVEGKLRLKYWRSFEPTVPPDSIFDMPFTVK
jgi:inhibitor of cysteine peptidase